MVVHTTKLFAFRLIEVQSNTRLDVTSAIKKIDAKVAYTFHC